MRQHVVSLVIAIVFIWQAGNAAAETRGIDVEKQKQAAIAQTYTMLGDLPVEDRRGFFAGLPSSDKADLWRWHLRSYMANHADLTAEQRAIILTMALMINSRLYELDHASPEGREFDALLNELMRTAGTVFTSDQTYAAFGRLGPEAPASSRTPTSSAARGLIPRTNEWLCECAVGYFSDFCFASTCTRRGCIDNGWCGWLGLQECTGICIR
jgi:hypothetical protein